MRISELLKPSLIKVDLKSDDKDELFEEMVQMFVNHDLLADRDVALEAIRGREAKMSTGIGKGLALPHGRVKELNGLLMALGISRQGIEYDALDGQPVHVVIMVLAETGNPLAQNVNLILQRSTEPRGQPRNLSFQSGLLRNGQFGGGRRRRCTHIGDKIADGEINFVTDR